MSASLHTWVTCVQAHNSALPKRPPACQICKVALREARMLKQVVHPNVVELIEVFRCACVYGHTGTSSVPVFVHLCEHCAVPPPLCRVVPSK